MVDMSLKVRIIPDTRELDKSLRGKKIGLGSGAKTTTGGGGAGASLKIAGMGKLLGIVGVVATVVSALGDFLKPIFSLFRVILSLLFLPLIPILKPVLKGLGKLASELAPIMIKLTKKVEEVLTPRLEKLIEGIVDFVITRADSFVKLIETVLDVWEKLLGPLSDVLIDGILKFLEFFAKNGAVVTQIIIDLLIWAGNFLKDKWETIKSILEWIGGFLEPLWNAIKSVLEFVIDSVIPTLQDAIIKFTNIIIDAFNQINKLLSFFGIGEGEDLTKIGETAFIGPQQRVLTPVERIRANQQNNNSFTQGNITQNISIQATINNDMDIRDLATKLAELSKDELAMSTGSQRF